MTRSVSEWRGKTDDAQAPPRVRLRVFERYEGICHRCGRKIGPADSWTLEHRLALILGGANREANLCVTCGWCLAPKNAEDMAAKSKMASIAKRHRGMRERPHGFRRPPNMKFNWSKGRYERVRP